MPTEPQFQAITAHISALPLRCFGALVQVWLVQDEAGATLVDAGPPGQGALVAKAVEALLGGPPARIVLTHAHFDHVGGLGELNRRWPDVPIFIHDAERPYLLGEASYRDLRPANWFYRLLATLVPQVTYPGMELQSLPATLGPLTVIPVPGHAPGMVALLHGADGACLAADTFRFKPVSAMPVFTPDRRQARQSMQLVAAQEFEWLLTSHCPPRQDNAWRRKVSPRHCG